jgi:hypothetical protein
MMAPVPTTTRVAARGYFMEACLLAVLILGPSIAVGLALDFEHGNLAEWVSAVATVAAFTAALAAARYAKQAFDLETEREERWRNEQRERQASQVAAWVQRFDYQKSDMEDGSVKVTFPGGQKFFAMNTSGLPVVDPVYEFQVRVVRESTFILSLGRHSEVLLTPSDAPQELPLPNEVRARLSQIATGNVDPKTREVPPLTVTVGVTFTDTANQHWVREPNGRLSPAPDELVAQREREASI